MPEPEQTTTDTTTAAPAGAPTDPSAGGTGVPPADGTTPGPDPDPAADGLRETFGREYVEKLRRSEAAHRVRAKTADALGARLVTAYAAATGKLADPSDLPVTPELLDDDGVPDPGKVAAAVDDLLTTKPHLATRRPVGDVGQGARPGDTAAPSLAGMLRAGAG